MLLLILDCEYHRERLLMPIADTMTLWLSSGYDASSELTGFTSK